MRSRKSRSKRRSPRKSSRGKRKSPSKKCRERLQKKIRINMAEYKSGRYSSRAQALAVSYAQIKKKYPSCKRSLSKKRK
jgi:hypothetical protein